MTQPPGKRIVLRRGSKKKKGRKKVVYDAQGLAGEAEAPQRSKIGGLVVPRSERMEKNHAGEYSRTYCKTIKKKVMGAQQKPFIGAV